MSNDNVLKNEKNMCRLLLELCLISYKFRDLYASVDILKFENMCWLVIMKITNMLSKLKFKFLVCVDSH